MTVRELLAVVRRRWAVVGLLLTATVAASVLMALSVPATYEASARLIFEPPADTGDTDRPSNPLLGVGGSQIVVADVVAQVVSDDRVRQGLVLAGAGEYSIGRGSDLAALLDVRAQAADPDDALLTVRLVSDAVARELDAQQTLAGAAPEAFITTRILFDDAEAQPVNDARKRALVAALGVGLVLSLTLVSIGDSLALRRRAARQVPLPTESGAPRPPPSQDRPSDGPLHLVPVLDRLPTGPDRAVWLVPDPVGSSADPPNHVGGDGG